MDRSGSEDDLMKNADAHGLRTIEQVRAIIGEELPAVRAKLFQALEATAIAFIERSPLLLLATTSADGKPDVSPKGDGPGFVAVEDERTLLILDRKGNKLIFGLQNILANPNVALIFLVPGTDETLRVRGRADLTADPALLERLSARGQPALIAIRIAVERCFFHCARAFLRAELWKPESWGERQRISFGRQLAPRLGGDAKLAELIDEGLEKGRADL
jgi:PPOX class probable FMN-dependent enzyme